MKTLESFLDEIEKVSKLIVVGGGSGAGKTTFTKKYLEKNPETELYEIDPLWVPKRGNKRWVSYKVFRSRLTKFEDEVIEKSKDNDVLVEGVNISQRLIDAADKKIHISSSFPKQFYRRLKRHHKKEGIIDALKDIPENIRIQLSNPKGWFPWERTLEKNQKSLK